MLHYLGLGLGLQPENPRRDAYLTLGVQCTPTTWLENTLDSQLAEEPLAIGERKGRTGRERP